MILNIVNENRYIHVVDITIDREIIFRNISMVNRDEVFCDFGYPNVGLKTRKVTFRMYGDEKYYTYIIRGRIRLLTEEENYIEDLAPGFETDKRQEMGQPINPKSEYSEEYERKTNIKAQQSIYKLIDNKKD